jgi:hypothetical protein
MPLLASASGSRYINPYAPFSGAPEGLIPSFRRYNGMFSMHSPREQVAVQTADPVSPLRSVQQLQEPSGVEFAESPQEATVSSCDPVPSPCSGDCVLSEAAGLCTGCFRTKTDITVWMRASNKERSMIVERAAQKRLEYAIVNSESRSPATCQRFAGEYETAAIG